MFRQGDKMYRYPMNLQLFQGEKTEQATPKKKREARKKGQVVQSKDINTALILLSVSLYIQIFNRRIAEDLYGLYQYVMSYAGSTATLYETKNLAVLMNEVIMTMLRIILPIIFVAMLTGLICSVLQVGVMFTNETLKVKFDKINPISGFKRLFSIRSLVEMVKSISKAAAMIYLTYSYLRNEQDLLVNLFDMEIGAIGYNFWRISFNILIRNIMFLLVLALFDYAYKRWQHNKDLRMSKQEIKDEYKQTEGDPFIKGKIKEKQRQISMSRMMQEVPKADVVITNPTHYAVAVQYDGMKHTAPIVVAKGQNLIAQNIKKKANEHDVPIVENKPLARALYATVDIGGAIPPDLFQAVAEVLAYVYSLKSS